MFKVASYTHVHSVARLPGGICKFARAAGSSAYVLVPEFTEGWALLRLPSGDLRCVNSSVYVFLGVIAPRENNRFHASTAGY